MTQLKSIFAACAFAALLVACGSKPTDTNNSTATTDANGTTVTEAPKTLTKEEKIAAANADMQAIEAGISGYRVEKKTYTNPAPEMYYDMSDYDAYYKGTELVKLVERAGEEGYLGESAVYFKAGKAFMDVSKSSYMDDLYSDRKVYIENDVFYAAIGKEKEPENTTPLSSVAELALDIETVNKSYEGGFKKSLDDNMKRLAAAKAR